MTNTEYWNPLVPELTVKDVVASLHFYLADGFTVRFHRVNPEFAYIELGQAQLMLEQEHDTCWNAEPLERPLGRGVNLQIETTDVAAITTRLLEAGYCLYREPKENWYAVSESREEGQIELLAQDPDGYLIRFIETLGSRNERLSTVSGVSANYCKC